MAVQLIPTGTTVTLPDGITLRTPGLVGEADASLVPPSQQRDAGVAAPGWMNDALAANGARSRYVVELRNTEPVRVEASMDVRTAYGEPAMVATVPPPPPEHLQVALVTDESGVMTWAVAEPSQPLGVRDGGDQTFVLRGTVPPAAGNVEQRGFGGWLAKKIIRFVVIPVAKRAAAEVGEVIVRRWEASNRPHRLRSFTPEDFCTRGGETVPAELLTRWSGQRVLLFVHGTSDRADTSFGGMGRTLVGDLHRAYGGRIFAFDHPTLATGPIDNVKWFLDQLPPEIDLRLDIVCSSRGGLVSRILAERLADPRLAPFVGTRRVEVDRLVFSATPNGGTRLVDTAHTGAYIDAMTNLLSLVPDNPVTDAADVIVSLAGDLAAGVVDQLTGLQAMHPDGDFLTWLNKQSRTRRRYFALTSDFEPQHAGLKKWATDVLLDFVLGAPNDFVVPTAGVYSDVGGGAFPIAEHHEFDKSANVSHGGFFRQNVTHAHLRRWLRAE